MVGGFLGVLGFEVLRTPFILVTDRSQAITPGLPDGRSHGKGMDGSRQPFMPGSGDEGKSQIEQRARCCALNI